MADKRVKDLPLVTEPTAGDVTIIDGLTSRSITIRALTGAGEPVIVTDDTTIINESVVAVQRVAPTLTIFSLPAVASRGGKPLAVFDWSTSIAADHELRFNANGTETVMHLASFSAYSNSAGLAFLTLCPSTTLNGWYLR